MGGNLPLFKSILIIISVRILNITRWRKIILEKEKILKNNNNFKINELFLYIFKNSFHLFLLLYKD